jgi:hypothetical protein
MENCVLKNVQVQFSKKQKNESKFLILGYIIEPQAVEELKEKGFFPYCFAHIKWAYEDFVRKDLLQPPAPRPGEIWLCDIMTMSNKGTKRLVATPVKMLRY